MVSFPMIYWVGISKDMHAEETNELAYIKDFSIHHSDAMWELQKVHVSFYFWLFNRVFSLVINIVKNM